MGLQPFHKSILGSMFVARYFLYHERVISGSMMEEIMEVPFEGCILLVTVLGG